MRFSFHCLKYMVFVKLKEKETVKEIGRVHLKFNENLIVPNR